MRRFLSCCFVLCLGLLARAEDRVSWEITPRVVAPGQPFRLQIMVESDIVLGGAQFISREIKPPRGMALRLSGQLIRPGSNEATFNFSGVAPEQLGEHVIPSFNLRFVRKAVVVPEIRLLVSDKVTYRREAQARAELVLPDRVFYVGELIRGAIRMRGGDDEAVVASYGLESLAEGFSMTVTAERQPLPDSLGQGIQTTFDLTPIREGAGEFSLNGIMLVQSGESGVFSQNGRDRPFAFRRRLTVAHVPERGRPPEWNGAIGRFVAEGLQVSKDKPEVGEPIRLRAILTGEGKAFVAGADISAMSAMTAAQAKAFADRGQALGVAARRGQFTRRRRTAHGRRLDAAHQHPGAIQDLRGVGDRQVAAAGEGCGAGAQVIAGKA